MHFRWILILLPFLGNCLVLAQTRTLVAEGNYVIQTKEGPKNYDDWKLWQEPDGGFSAEVLASAEAYSQGSSLTQVFRFDQQFVPIGYSITAVRAGDANRASVNCRSESSELSCSTEFGGRVFSAFTKTRRPSLVLLEDFAGLDLPWFQTAFFRIAQLDEQSSSVDTYVLRERTVGQLVLELDSPAEKLKSNGEGTMDSSGKTQVVRSYETGPSDEPMIVNVDSNGLVVSIRFKGEKNSLFELVGYKQYKQWVP